ncbi:MAG: ferredoxin--NADP reductase [Bacteroidota bacterium]
MLKTYILPLTELIHETEDAATLVFEQGLVDRISYYSGQYITLKVMIDGETFYRSYSLSSTPRLDRFLAITIKRVKGGMVSNYVLDHFQAGRLVEFLAPAGNFYLETVTKNQRHVVLIGAGSGITPLMSMIRGVLFHEPQSTVSLIYANRKEEDIIFRERLTALSVKFPDRLFVQQILSQPESPPSGNSLTGRINPTNVGSILTPIVERSALPASFWLCGPNGLMETVRQGLQQLGMSSSDIHQERFVADEEMQKKQTAGHGPTRMVRLIRADKTIEIQVPYGTTVLEAALAQGQDLPYSCKRGICSTCMADLEDGKVEMDNPESLLPFEIEMGKVLVCQCHPLSDDVRIRIGG